MSETGVPISLLLAHLPRPLKERRDPGEMSKYESFETKAFRGGEATQVLVEGWSVGVRKGVDAGCIALPHLEPSDEKKKTLVFDFSAAVLMPDLFFYLCVFSQAVSFPLLFSFSTPRRKMRGKESKGPQCLQRKVLRIYTRCRCLHAVKV